MLSPTHHVLGRPLLHALPALALLEPQLPCVPAVALEILAELPVLVLDRVLANVGDEEEDQERGEDAEGRRDKEGVLRRSDGAVAARRLDVGKYPRPYKGADLAGGGGDAVVRSADAGGRGLGGEEADAGGILGLVREELGCGVPQCRCAMGRAKRLLVTGPQLAQGEEDAVHHGKARHDIGLGELLVRAGHDEAHHGLQGDAHGKRVPRADPVADIGTEHGAGDVEEVDDGVPAKDGSQGHVIVAVDGLENGRAVDAKGVDGEVVDEPDGGDDEQARAVELGDEAVGDLDMGHAVARELLGLLDAHAQEEEHEREDDADAERGAPLRAVVDIVAGGGDDVGHKGADDEAHVDGGVGEEDEPAVAGPGLELAAGLGAAYRAGGILAPDADADEEAPVFEVSACCSVKEEEEEKPVLGRGGF